MSQKYGTTQITVVTTEIILWRSPQWKLQRLRQWNATINSTPIISLNPLENIVELSKFNLQKNVYLYALKAAIIYYITTETLPKILIGLLRPNAVISKLSRDYWPQYARYQGYQQRNMLLLRKYILVVKQREGWA